MLETVLEAVVSALQEGGLKALREFPDQKADLGTETLVAVGLESCKFLGAGLGEYLGTSVKEDGNETELFGKRLELRLRLEVFSPYSKKSGAQACLDAVTGMSAALERLPAGLKPLELGWEELRADDRLRVYRCPCTLRCHVFLVAERSGEGAEFLDFVLKGRVVHGDE